MFWQSWKPIIPTFLVQKHYSPKCPHSPKSYCYGRSGVRHRLTHQPPSLSMTKTLFAVCVSLTILKTKNSNIFSRETLLVPILHLPKYNAFGKPHDWNKQALLVPHRAWARLVYWIHQHLRQMTCGSMLVAEYPRTSNLCVSAMTRTCMRVGMRRF